MRCRSGAFDPAHVYDILPEIISALNVFSLAFCAFLYLKVRAAHHGPVPGDGMRKMINFLCLCGRAGGQGSDLGVQVQFKLIVIPEQT